MKFQHRYVGKSLRFIFSFFFLDKGLKGEETGLVGLLESWGLGRGEIAPWLSDLSKEVHRIHSVKHVEDYGITVDSTKKVRSPFLISCKKSVCCEGVRDHDL